MSQLIFICQACGTPIENLHGHLGIDVTALAEYRAAAREWDAANPDGSGTMASLLDHPAQVTWTTHHEACEPNTCGYCIQVDQIRDLKSLIKWTAHLMGKAWLADSDWDHLLEKIADGTDSRVRIAPSRAAP